MMLDKIFYYIHSFLVSNQLIALVIFVVLAVFLWKKPWTFLKVTLWVLALFVGIYIFSYLNESAFIGASKKHEITTEREEQLFKNN